MYYMKKKSFPVSRSTIFDLNINTVLATKDGNFSINGNFIFQIKSA